jgi:hypothetical protein
MKKKNKYKYTYFVSYVTCDGVFGTMEIFTPYLISSYDHILDMYSAITQKKGTGCAILNYKYLNRRKVK